MASFSAGTTFTDGVANDVTAAKLGALVNNATPTSGLIQDRTAETVTATNDTLLIGDASDSNNLKRITVANFAQTLPTAKVTTGTIDTATLGTTTGTAATFTTGTITTLTAGTTTSTAATITTGTIPTLVATTLVTTGAGTASSPAIVPTGDTNTGIFFPAADTIAFSEGGTEAMRIDSNGKVLIGTTSNDTGGRLEVKQASSETGIGIQSSGTDDSKLYFRTASGSYGGDILFNGSYVKFSSGTTERLRIDSSGNVGIGETNPQRQLHVKSSSAAEILRLQSASDTGQAWIGIYKANGTRKANVGFGSSVNEEFFIANEENGPMSFYTNNTERLRITSGGEVLVGKTQTNGTVVGVFINTNGKGNFTSDADAPLFANRLTNDGTLVEFAQASIIEGTISVSGTTVSYNGGHLSRYSQLPSGQRDPAIKKGTVLSNLDEMCVWNDAEGNPLPNEQLNKVKISDVEGDNNVAGVFVNWDDDDQDNPFDLNMAMTGDMIIRIAQGVTVSRGDLLMSAGDGTAKPQGDDIRKAKTIAKVTSTNVTCTYEDGSYCVPCVLMAC